MSRAAAPAGAPSGMHPTLLAAALTYAVIAQGAFYPGQALVLAGLVAAAALALRRMPRLPRGAFVACGILAAGLVVAMLLEPDGDPRIAASVLAVAVGATAIGAAHARAGTFAPLAGVLMFLGAGASLAGIAGAAWHLEPLALEAQGIWRAASSLTYANSLGAVLVPCLAAAALRLIARDRFLERAAFAVILAGLLVSMSRAAFVSLAVGAVAALLADRHAVVRAVVAARTAAVSGFVAAIGVLPSVFGEPEPLFAVAGLIAAAALCVPGSEGATGKTIVAAALALGATSALAFGMTGRLEGLGERLVNEDRARIWRVSLDAGMDALPDGQGLGRFTVFEERHGRIFRIRYAHNEPIQALVETGLVGPVAFAGAAIAFGVPLVRRRRAAPLAFGVGAAFLAHGMLDFVWHVPAVVLIDFLFVGVVLGMPEPHPVQEAEPSRRA